MYDDFLLEKAAELFNTWTETERTVSPNDVLLVKIVFVEYSDEGVEVPLPMGLLPGDKRADYAEANLRQEVTCLYVGDSGANLTATAADFVVIATASYTPAEGLPVFQINSPDGWSETIPDGVWQNAVSLPGFNAATFTIVASEPMSPDDDVIWMVNPLLNGDQPGSYQLFRVRPLMQSIERTFKFTLDGANSSGEETYGDFMAMLPIFFDAETEISIQVNQQTVMPANSPSGYFGIELHGEDDNAQGALPRVFFDTSDPSNNYSSMGQGGNDNLRPVSGMFQWSVFSPVPEGFFADVTITMVYKQRFKGWDNMTPIEPT